MWNKEGKEWSEEMCVMWIYMIIIWSFILRYKYYNNYIFNEQKYSDNKINKQKLRGIKKCLKQFENIS